MHIPGTDRTDKAASQCEGNEQRLAVNPPYNDVSVFLKRCMVQVRRIDRFAFCEQALYLITGNTVLSALWPVPAIPVKTLYFHIGMLTDVITNSNTFLLFPLQSLPLFLQMVDRLCPLRQFNNRQIEPVQASAACLCTGKADAPCPYLLVWMRNLEP